MQISGANFVNPMSGESSRAEKDDQNDDNAHLMIILASYSTGQQEEMLECDKRDGAITCVLCCDLHLALKVFWSFIKRSV